MCADIDYKAQSDHIRRLNRLFGNGASTHLDLACGTGPHIRHFIDYGFQSCGLDINQPMLDLAQVRCPEAEFTLQDMCSFRVNDPVDLITCFLYSIHYNDGISKLKQCLSSVYHALSEGGIFCFNAVEKTKIDNRAFVRHSTEFNDSQFTFSSGWNYSGAGERQSLKLCIEKSNEQESQVWQDEHPMVAVSFDELKQLLLPDFEVHIFEHDYGKITPLEPTSGNAIICLRKTITIYKNIPIKRPAN